MHKPDENNCVTPLLLVSVVAREIVWQRMYTFHILLLVMILGVVASAQTTSHLEGHTNLKEIFM